MDAREVIAETLHQLWDDADEPSHAAWLFDADRVLAALAAHQFTLCGEQVDD